MILSIFIIRYSIYIYLYTNVTKFARTMATFIIGIAHINLRSRQSVSPSIIEPQALIKELKELIPIPNKNMKSEFSPPQETFSKT